MNFIILADKFQKGMKSKGAVGLLNINKRQTVIDHQYSLIKNKYPESKIIYVYGFDAKRVRSYSSKRKQDIEYIYNKDYENKNYAYSLYLAEKYLDEECFIAFGDTVFRSNLFKNLLNNESQIFVNKLIVNDLGCVINNNIVSHISFGLKNYIGDMYFLTKESSHVIKDILSNARYHNYFIFELINKSIDEGAVFYPYYGSKKSVVSYKEVTKYEKNRNIH